jgi:hypothetical protein
MGRGGNNHFTVNHSINFTDSVVKHQPTVQDIEDQLVEQVQAMDAQEMLDNLRLVRKAARTNRLHVRPILEKLKATSNRSNKIMIRKYADLILALPKEDVQLWVNGMTYSPLEYLPGNLNNDQQKQLIQYIDNPKSPFASENKRNRLKKHLGLSYRQVTFHK